MSQSPPAGHVWLPSGRSLCDRRDRGNAVKSSEDTKFCAACLLIAYGIYAYAWHSTAERSQDTKTVEEAIKRLQSTRWSQISSPELAFIVQDTKDREYPWPTQREEPNR